MKILQHLMAVLLLMLSGLAFSADATQSAPPGVTMNQGVPIPPSCSAATQELYWDGDKWSCQVTPGGSSGVSSIFLWKGGPAPNSACPLAGNTAHSILSFNKTGKGVYYLSFCK